MKAMVITHFGGPEVLALRDMPEPPADGRVIVRVEAAGINFADILAARGAYPGTAKPPLIAGREFAGTREDTGQRVMGYTQSAAFAERIAVRPELIWAAPEGWTFEEAAAFPVNYFTAYFAYWKAELLGPHDANLHPSASKPAPPPQRPERSLGTPAPGAPRLHPSASKPAPGAPRRPRVLIHAAAGGVGTAAVQIGAILGVEMFGTSSSDDKLAHLKKLGLHHGINYAREDYEAQVKALTGNEGVDAVFEMLGGEHVAKSVACLRFLGRVITYGAASGERAAFDPRILYNNQTSVHGLWLSPLSLHAEIMQPAAQKMSQWIAQGKLRPVVGHVLPLERAAEGYRMLLERKNLGKVVLKVGARS